MNHHQDLTPVSSIGQTSLIINLDLKYHRAFTTRHPLWGATQDEVHSYEGIHKMQHTHYEGLCKTTHPLWGATQGTAHPLWGATQNTAYPMLGGGSQNINIISRRSHSTSLRHDATNNISITLCIGNSSQHLL